MQPRCVLCNKKTFGYVTQNMPSSILVNWHLFHFISRFDLKFK